MVKSVGSRRYHLKTHRERHGASAGKERLKELMENYLNNIWSLLLSGLVVVRE